MNVGNWLDDLGLGAFAAKFEENLIDEAALRQLTEADLSELGLPLGPRVKIRAALEELRSVPSSQTRGVSDRRPDTGPTPDRAERRRITVMFVDLVGSTALQTRLDPEDMAQVIRTYQDSCAGIITRFTGHVAKYMGDGVLAYFGWPQTHEDEVAQAVRAGLAIADSVTEIRAPDGTIMRARVGLATGLVVVGDLVGEEESRERTVVGETPNLAARLQAQAQPDQVVISEATRSLLGRRFELEDLGEFELKGIEGKTRAYSVQSERAIESRFEATNEELMPIVGREHELALIMDRWHRATDGEGQGVLLVGEAGIGKSRTVRAVLDELSNHPHVRIRYQCSPNHVDSALWPVVRHLTFASQIRPEDDPEVRRSKLSSVIVQTVEDAEDARFLGRLLGLDDDRPGSDALDPAVQRARTLEALVRQLLILAQGQPALVVLEDAHWSDPTTLEMIERTLASINGARVMVLITSRPDQQPQLDAYPHMSRIPLNRLGRDDIEAIVRRQGHGRDMSPELIDEIIRRTDGVPLFAEELTKTVLETGDTHVPATLHDSLMARLDRIGEVKEIAQVASCIGREVDFRLLSEIVDIPDGELEEALAKLVAAGLMFRRGTPPEARYTFKHALLQDTAYESLLKSRRRDTHKRIASVLEGQLTEMAENEPELVAYHLTAAEMPERAIPYWEEAGRRSAERSANAEALGHLREALKAIRSLPENAERERMELGVYAETAGPLMSTKGYSAPETVEVFGHVRRLVSKVGDDSLIFPSLYQQWVVPIFSGEADQAREVAEEFVSRAIDRADPALILMGKRILGICLFELSRYEEALDSLNEVERLYRADEHEDLRFRFGQDPLAAAMCFRGMAHFALGDFAAARSDMEVAVARAEAVNHANTLGYIYSIGDLTVAWAVDDRAHVAPAAQRAVELCERYGMIAWRAYSRVFRGWSSVLAGNTDSGFESIAAGFEDLTESRTGMHLRHCLALHAEALHASGRHREGLEVIERAFDSTPDQTWILPEMHRIKGCLLTSTEGPERGLEEMETALELSQAAGAPGMELRVAISFAGVASELGRSPEGRKVLADAIGKVASGQGAPIMRRANQLLLGYR